jgi:hypothetical protein
VIGGFTFRRGFTNGVAVEVIVDECIGHFKCVLFFGNKFRLIN